VRGKTGGSKNGTNCEANASPVKKGRKKMIEDYLRILSYIIIGTLIRMLIDRLERKDD
jgi:hypothetical protein